MPNEGEHRCEFMCHVYKSEAPGSLDQKKKKKNPKDMFGILVHLNIACFKSESFELSRTHGNNYQLNSCIRKKKKKKKKK